MIELTLWINLPLKQYTALPSIFLPIYCLQLSFLHKSDILHSFPNKVVINYILLKQNHRQTPV